MDDSCCSHAEDNVHRKFTSRYVIRVFGNVIDWKSQKQKCVTKASTYVSEVKFIKELINIFNIKLSSPVKIYEDNIRAINIANYGNFTKNSKHIQIHYHFVHEIVKEKEIEILKVK